MPVFGRHYRSGHAAVVHAVSTPYRERSHFDGQDVLESGFPGPGSTESGWLNRAISAIPSGGRIGTKGGIAVGYSTPLVLRGSAAVLGWAPQLLPVATDDTANRVLDLYAHSDPILHLALAKGLETEKLASAMSDPKQQRGALNSIIGMRLAAEGAARLIAADDGPRIAALAFDGWDTHVNEGGAQAVWHSSSLGSMPPLTRSNPGLDQRGTTRLSLQSPSSGERRASTARVGRIMERRRSPCSMAAPSKAAASSQIGLG